jgi:uncharacterized protein YgiM (DUF1202 family)
MIERRHARTGWPRDPGVHQRRGARVALLVLVLVCELSMAALPALARVPTRTAAAITQTRLRAAPERKAEPLLRLPAGALLTVHGRAENGWYRARRGQLEGYILSGDVATAPIPAADEEAIDEAAVESDVVELRQRAGGRNRERRQLSFGETLDAGAIFAASELNLRASPSRDAAVIVSMPRGARVEPTGEQQDGFVEVRWDGTTGWALGKHLAAQRPVKTRRADTGATWRRRELIAIIYDAADKYGQPREDMLRVARCESDLVPTAVNGPGGSYGLFQFKPGTWLSTPFAEYDIFDPRANANAAAWMWAQGRRREWVCQ